MKRIFRSFVILKLILLGFLSQANAGQVSIETDPATFFLKGHAAHVFYNPDAMKSLRLGIGTYSMEFPDFMVNMNEKNADEGWIVKIKNSVAFFSEYDLSENRNSTYWGLQLAHQNYQVTLQDNSSDFSNGLMMLSFGYRWYATDHFYLKPWAGAGYQFKLSGDNCVGSNCYDINPLMGFVTVHAGYSF